jgi:uncharacterized coiled-coil protein SlyX
MKTLAKVISELQEKCAMQEHKIAKLSATVVWFEEQFRLSQHRRFERSSEQQTNSRQLSVFNEAEVEAKPMDEPTIEKITYWRQEYSLGGLQPAASETFCRRLVDEPKEVTNKSYVKQRSRLKINRR